MPTATRVAAALMLLIALATFIGTDRWLGPLDDETEFVTFARQSLSETFDDYWQRSGQPEHPPLGNVLLHLWLPIGGAAQWSLRLPSMLLYLGGLLVFAFAARRIASTTGHADSAPDANNAGNAGMGDAGDAANAAFLTLLGLGVAWPFGFHFGRVAEWYSLAFFLVGAMTLSYLRFLEKGSAGRLAAFVLPAILLVYTTYYGWAIVGCLVLDLALVRGRREAGKLLLVTLGAMALAYIPLWRTFVQQVLHGSEIVTTSDASLPSRVLNASYAFYALFVSESVAPWFAWVSAPTGIAILASIALAASLAPPAGRRSVLWFAALFAGMVVIGIVNTKRLLSISGWLLLPLALALAGAGFPARRRALAVLLASIALVGWGGVVARSYYAALHFVEPWPALADQGARTVAVGGVVVTNSDPLRFSLNYSLLAAGLVPRDAVPGWVDHPSVIDVSGWRPAAVAGKNSVLFVRGVNTNLIDATDRAGQWLADSCVKLAERELVADSGYEFKRRHFPNAGQLPFRISVREYDCGAATAT